MLIVEQDQGRLCDGMTRREWLRIGSLGLAGLSLPELLQAREGPPTARPGRAKACIVMMLLGGPPQHETWDPKPNAPIEIRGDLRPIQTATPGILIGETMPRIAQWTNRIAVLRAMCTNDSAHSSSAYYMTTGRPHLPVGVENARPGPPNNWPCPGAVLRRLRRDAGGLPAAITVPEQAANDGNLTWPGQDAGYLGQAADPWLLTCDPSAPNFQIPGLGLPAEVPPVRFDGRRTLLEQVNQHLDGRLDVHGRGGPGAVYSAQSQQAFDLIASSQSRQAFNLAQEPAAVRDRYGRTRFGQSLLLARRLVEAGVSLVRVNWTRVAGAPNNGHWDTHSQNTAGLRALMPIVDRGYSALLEDLDVRGLLDETLIVWMAEFGRTPRLNGAGGRDHWGNVFSVALAGGGIAGGRVIGASDSIAGYPRDGRVLPPDLLATMFHSLGYPSDTEFHDNLGRPLPVSRGEVIRGVF
jgi:Protein of unknown function (DUF1501)